jgi:basic membrane protein A and related proteins
VLALAVAGSAVVLAATHAPRARAATLPSPRIGLVANTNGLGDRSFNQLSAQAVLTASVKLRARIDIRPSPSAASYIPNLQAMAAQGYDLVIAVGPAEEHAVGVVAREYPDVRFAIVGDSYASRGIGALANVEGIEFADEESGYLAGYLAGLVEQTSGSQPTGANTVATISSTLVPAATRYVAGFRAGVRAADPGVQLLAGFSNASTAPARCSSIAGKQIRAGATIIFPVAGACSIGAFDAAHTAHVWAVGSELDQSALTDAILVSAVDRPDRAVYLTLEALVHGTLRTGRDVEFGLAQGAVGLAGMNAAVPVSIRRRLRYVTGQVQAGRITIPTAPAPGRT